MTKFKPIGTRHTVYSSQERRNAVIVLAIGMFVTGMILTVNPSRYIATQATQAAFGLPPLGMGIFAGLLAFAGLVSIIGGRLREVCYLIAVAFFAVQAIAFAWAVLAGQPYGSSVALYFVLIWVYVRWYLNFKRWRTSDAQKSVEESEPTGLVGPSWKDVRG